MPINVSKPTQPVDPATHQHMPAVKVPQILQPFQGFVDFIRSQGVVGLAVGIVVGAQIKSIVDSFVVGIINPLIGLLLPGNTNLALKVFHVSLGRKTATFAYGVVLTQLISFIIVLALVYFLIRGLKLDQLDKKDTKEEPKKDSQKDSQKDSK